MLILYTLIRENESFYGLIPFKKNSASKVLSGTLLISGTAIGAGMLGIPLVTAAAGFLPACLITVAVWFFMLLTGLLFLEVSLWMPEGSNILSMSQQFLGKKGKIVAGVMFLFLYYCLLVAYFAGGAPMLNATLSFVTGIELPAAVSYLVLGLILGVAVHRGHQFIDRSNIILSIGLVLTFVFLIGSSISHVSLENLQAMRFLPLFLLFRFSLAPLVTTM